MAKLMKWDFLSLESFKTNDGAMHREDFSDLKDSVIRREERLIPAAGGFWEVTVNRRLNPKPKTTGKVKYSGSIDKWHVTYAVYDNVAIDHDDSIISIAVLTAKSIYDFKNKKYSPEHSAKLAKDKILLDKAVAKYVKKHYKKLKGWLARKNYI